MTKLTSLLLVLALALPWIFLIRWRDVYDREPARLIATLFALGIAAAAVVEPLNSALILLLGGAGLVLFWTTALVEEAAKFAVTHLRAATETWFNEPVDGMVYMTSAALGFVVMENFIYVLGGYREVPRAWSSDAAFQHVFWNVAATRAIFPTVAHLAWSAIIGYALSRRVLYRRPAWELASVVVGVATLHAWYNASGNNTALAIAAIGVAAVIAVVLWWHALATSPVRLGRITRNPRHGDSRHDATTRTT